MQTRIELKYLQQDHQNELHFFFFLKIMIQIILDSRVMFLSLLIVILILNSNSLVFQKNKINKQIK